MPRMLAILVCASTLIIAAESPDRTEEPGICSSIALERSPALSSEPQMTGWDPLEEELLRRIEQTATQGGETITPVAYIHGRDREALEVAGLPCEKAMSYVHEEILDGYGIELAVADAVLKLDLTSVADMQLGPNGELHVALNPLGTSELREMTTDHLGEDVTVRIDGVGTVERITILSPITSGRISLKGEKLPAALTERLRLALPVSAGECVAECRSGFSWTRDGVRYVYEPRQ